MQKGKKQYIELVIWLSEYDLTALAEDLGLAPSTHMAPHN